jgi:SAM-dependent methyltransferase
MHRKFLGLMCCPETGEPLKLYREETLPSGRIISGKLVSLSGRQYPIVRGVPRFVDREEYASSFGYEWNRWARLQFDSENEGKPMAGHSTRMWEAITKASEDRVNGKTILEFGCGSGRFLDVVRRKGGIAVGIDMSLAVESARSNFGDDPDVLILQADIFNPPFRSGTFDGGYAIGVLHHTPDPSAGLRALAMTVRRGGWVSCVVYPRRGLYNYSSVERFRRVTNWLRPSLGYYPALIYSYLSAYAIAPSFSKGKGVRHLTRVLQYLEKKWVVSLDYLPDVHWRVLDTFDAITPRIASTHTCEEVRGWMAGAGCVDIQTADWGDTSMVGVKA